MASDAKELFKLVKQDINDRKIWEDKQATCYRVRFGTQKRRVKPFKNASDYPWLLVDTDIEKAKPAFVEQILGPELIASFFAKKSQAKAFTTAVSRWFNYQLKEKSNLVFTYLQVIDAFMMQGKGCVKVRWNPKAKQLEYLNINPLFVIVPLYTGPLNDASGPKADRLTHVQWISRPEYERSAEAMGYNPDRSFIDKITAKAWESPDGKQTDQLSEAKNLREGVGWHRKKDMIVLWETLVQEKNGTLTVNTYSPILPEEWARTPFKFPYKHNRFPIISFDNEVTDGSWYSPRGYAEILGVYQQILKALLDTEFDYAHYCNRPVFQPESGAAPINVQNIELIPGQLINAQIKPVQFPTPPLNFIEMQQNVRGIAQDRIGAADVGLSTQTQGRPSKQPKTAEEAKQIGMMTSSRQNLSARIFSLSHKELLFQSWDLLRQYNPHDLDYFWRDEFLKLPPEAFKEEEDIYELRATGSADGYSREMEIQQLLQLRSQFVGTPTWNDAECQKRLLELVNPELVKYLYIDVPTGLQDQAKVQADEIATMFFGFTPKPSQEDNDLVHIQTIEEFKAHEINTGQTVPPAMLMQVIIHEDAHILALRHKAPGQYKINQQMLLTIQSQNATIAKAVQAHAEAGLAQSGAPPGAGQPPVPQGALAPPGGPSQAFQLAIPNPYAGITGVKPPVPPNAAGMLASLPKPPLTPNAAQKPG